MSTIIIFVGYLISIIGFFISLSIPDWLRNSLIIVSCLAFFVSILLEVIAYFKNKPRSFNKKKNIEYMEKIIKSDGKIIVFAGKLSWVNSDKIKKAIMDKKGDLYLCVNKDAPFLEDFRKAGVNVLTYGNEDFSPHTHFTIIRPQTPTEKIAITSINDTYKKEKRFVHEFEKDKNNFINNWIICAAIDLFELTKLLNKGDK